jgi:hypothetical protein
MSDWLMPDFSCSECLFLCFGPWLKAMSPGRKPGVESAGEKDHTKLQRKRDSWQ